MKQTIYLRLAKQTVTLLGVLLGKVKVYILKGEPSTALERQAIVQKRRDINVK